MIREGIPTPESVRDVCYNARSIYKADAAQMMNSCLYQMHMGLPIKMLFVEDKPIAILLATTVWEGVSTMAGIFTDDITKHPIEFVRAMRRHVALIMDQEDLHRVDFTVRADYPTGQRFAEALGFKFEARLECYGVDKTDYFLYVRTK